MGNRLSVQPDLPRRGNSLPGYEAILFIRAVIQHPAGSDHSSPLLLFEKIHGEAVVAFTLHETLGIRNAVLSRPPTHGPHARVPTLRRSRYRDRRKARYRLGRAHPWPGRIFACWTTNEISWSHRHPPIPIDQHCLVASMHQRPSWCMKPPTPASSMSSSSGDQVEQDGLEPRRP